MTVRYQLFFLPNKKTLVALLFLWLSKLL